MVLIDASKEGLCSVVDEKVAEAIVRVREGRVIVSPGYDGVYGRPVLDELEFRQHEEEQKNLKLHSQKGLIDF